MSVLRLTRPEQIKGMRRSLEQVGQLQGVVVRKHGKGYQLLDGFKRYYGAVGLKWKEIQVQEVLADDITAKTMMMSYNQQGRSLVDYEEARIVHSLKTQHSLPHKQIAGLLSRSISWVSRRLSFIERLEDEVGTHLQLGKITLTHARELVKLPRGKQVEFLHLIVNHQFTSRQTTVLIRQYLQSRSKQEQDYVLSHPYEVLDRQSQEEQISDSRLGEHGNRILISSRLLAHQQHIFIGRCTNPPLGELPQTELEILTEGLVDIVKKAEIIQSIISKSL